jgi:hypothetical protein
MYYQKELFTTFIDKTNKKAFEIGFYGDVFSQLLYIIIRINRIEAMF